MTKKPIQTLNLAVWCLLANVFVWGQVFGFGYVWDDHPSVENNHSLRVLTTLFKGFGYDFWALQNEPHGSGYWRPIVTAAYVIFGNMFGFRAAVFHAVSLLVHLVNSWLVLKIFSRLGSKEASLGLAVLFFSLHPLHAETIGFISAWPDLLSALGGFSMLYWILDPEPTAKAVACAATAFCFCLLSKESGVAFLPIGIFLLHKSNPKSFYQKSAVLFSVFAIYLTLHMWIANPFAVEGTVQGSTFRAALVFQSFALSLGTVWVPWVTTPLRAISGQPWYIFVVCFLFLASLMFSFFSYPNRRKQLTLFAFLFFAFWVPVSQVIPIELHFGDRYFYLMVFAASFLLADVRLPSKVLIVFAALWGAWAFRSAQKWKSDETLWKSVVVHSPTSPVAWNQLGTVFLGTSSYVDAEDAFSKALSLNPDYAEPKLNLIVTKLKNGKLKEAEEKAMSYVTLYPQDARGWDSLASAQVASGKLGQAIVNQQKAIELLPSSEKYRYNMELLYELAAKGYEQDANWKMAKEMYEKILIMHPGSSNAIFGLQKMNQILQLQEGK